MPTTLFPDAVITGEVLERLRLPSDQRYELIAGIVESSPLASVEHAEATATMGRLLYTDSEDWLVLAGSPGVYVQRKPDTVLGPDVLMISRERFDQRDPQRAWLTVAPELIVEI